MKNLPPNLTDKYIFKNCHGLDPDNLPNFLTTHSKTHLKMFLESFGDDGNISAKKIDEFHDLWKELLSDAITFLKLTDKREFFWNGVEPIRDEIAFGVAELHKYFEQYRSFEAFLYGADRFYRDHIMHVFRVWVLGIWLIEQFNNKVHWDVKEVQNNLNGLSISNDEILAMWCVIALTHDLGYPLDKVEKVKKSIDIMMNYFGGRGSTDSYFVIPAQHYFINDFILRFISSKLQLNKLTDDSIEYKTALQSKYYLKFSRSFENFNHGIISCVLLMKNLVYFLESDFDLSKPFTDAEDARQFYIRREILRAIASHTSTDIYHLFPNSLAFILILSDEIQLWGRPNFYEMKSGKQTLEFSIRLPRITKRQIIIELDIGEQENIRGNESGGKEMVFSIFRKWHKWLRSALGAKERNYGFSITAYVKPIKGNIVTYKFINKINNVFNIYIDGKRVGLDESLYS